MKNRAKHSAASLEKKSHQINIKHGLGDLMEQKSKVEHKEQKFSAGFDKSKLSLNLSGIR